MLQQSYHIFSADLLKYTTVWGLFCSWNPCADRVPIHSWLHPWLPLMGDRLQVLWAPIRQKLGQALSIGAGWHPSDKSAMSILQPWVGVFSRVSFTLIWSVISFILWNGPIVGFVMELRV